MDVSIKPIKDEHGNIELLIPEGRDITDRILTEQQIQQNEARQSHLLNSLPMAFYVAQPFGDYGGTWVSNQIEKIAGFTKKQFMEDISLWARRLHLEDREHTLQAFDSITEKEMISVEYRWQAQNGSYLWIMDLAVLIRNEDDTPKEIVGTWIDITDRKLMEQEKEKLESQLRQTMKLEAIGSLAGGIAHDFNNILSAIIGYTELGKLDLPEDSPAITSLDSVLAASMRAKKLVQHILTFSRAEHHNPKPVRVSKIIKETNSLLRALLPTTIDLRSSILDSDAVVLADETQLQQLLINLCTNSSHALNGKEGAFIELRLEKTILDIHQVKPGFKLSPGPCLHLSVIDNGKGMSSKTMERIFDPFFTTKEVNEGTGMGLSIVHGIVQSHGAMIDVESTPDIGTRVNVYFNLISELTDDTKAKQPEDKVKLLKGEGRILFIDDEDLLVGLGEKILTHLGYEVTVSTDSAEAFKLFQEDPDFFDLIITDQTMPKIPGTELAKRILDIRPDMPIVLCTGHSSMVSEDQAEALGIRAFLMKPVSRNTLAKTVHQILVSH